MLVSSEDRRCRGRGGHHRRRRCRCQPATISPTGPRRSIGTSRAATSATDEAGDGGTGGSGRDRARHGSPRTAARTAPASRSPDEQEVARCECAIARALSSTPCNAPTTVTGSSVTPSNRTGRGLDRPRKSVATGAASHIMTISATPSDRRRADPVGRRSGRSAVSRATSSCSAMAGTLPIRPSASRARQCAVAAGAEGPGQDHGERIAEQVRRDRCDGEGQSAAPDVRRGRGAPVATPVHPAPLPCASSSVATSTSGGRSTGRQATGMPGSVTADRYGAAVGTGPRRSRDGRRGLRRGAAAAIRRRRHR